MCTTLLFQSAFAPWARRASPSAPKRERSRNARRSIAPAVPTRPQFVQRTIPRAKLKRPERYDASDWAKSLLSLPRSMILRRVSGRIVPNLVVAAAVSAGYTELCALLPPDVHVSVSPLPHTFLATAMSLLLVFRTNAAYDRYWEGRKVWGRLINISRSMARLCANAMPPAHAAVAGRLIVMYAHALMHHLQERREDDPFVAMCRDVAIPESWHRSGVPASVSSQTAHVGNGPGSAGAVAVAQGAGNWGSDWAPDPRPLSAMRLVSAINGAANKPLEVVVQLGKTVRLAMEDKETETGARTGGSGQSMNISIERQMLEQAMADLIDIMGACERIVKSPVPLSWSRHTSRLLSIWSLTLPFVLVPLEGFLCIPTVAVICWGIFSIEEIAHILEDPFLQQRYSLPLEDLCNTIETDVLGQLIR